MASSDPPAFKRCVHHLVEGGAFGRLVLEAELEMGRRFDLPHDGLVVLERAGDKFVAVLSREVRGDGVGVVPVPRHHFRVLARAVENDLGRRVRQNIIPERHLVETLKSGAKGNAVLPRLG